MEGTNRRRAALVGGVVVMIAISAWAQDWPQWRGPNRDGKVTGFTAPQPWPSELTQKWKVTVGTGCATPALVGGKLYVFARQGEDEVIQCLNAGTGKELWRDKYAAQAVTGAARRHPGPRSSVAVAQGKVVTLGVGGVLSCLDAATGKLAWRRDPFPKIVPRFFTSMSPIIVDGTVIAYLGGQDNGAVIAYDLASGNEKWRWGAEGPDYGSPVLLTAAGTKQIVMPTERSIVGIGIADGKLLWQLPFPPQRRAYDGFAVKKLWSNADLAVQFNTPVLKDGLLFGLSNSGNLFCINARTGQTAWTDATQRDRGGFTAILDAGSCLLALPSNSELIVFKPSSEQYTELAKIKVADTPTYAHPVIAGNRIYVKDQETLIMWTIQ